MTKCHCGTELVFVDDSYTVATECPVCTRDEIISELGEDMDELRQERDEARERARFYLSRIPCADTWLHEIEKHPWLKEE